MRRIPGNNCRWMRALTLFAATLLALATFVPTMRVARAEEVDVALEAAAESTGATIDYNFSSDAYTFDKNTRTLTITGDLAAKDASLPVISAKGFDLIVRVSGSATISGSNTGISVTGGSLTFEGGGTLNITTTKAAGAAIGITADGVTLTGGTLNITATAGAESTSGAASAYGIRSLGNLANNGCNVTLSVTAEATNNGTAGAYGLSCDPTMTIQGGKVTIDQVYAKGGQIVTAQGLAGNYVYLSGGEVIAKAKGEKVGTSSAKGDATGIYAGENLNVNAGGVAASAEGSGSGVASRAVYAEGRLSKGGECIVKTPTDYSIEEHTIYSGKDVAKAVTFDSFAREGVGVGPYIPPTKENEGLPAIVDKNLQSVYTSVYNDYKAKNPDLYVSSLILNINKIKSDEVKKIRTDNASIFSYYEGSLKYQVYDESWMDIELTLTDRGKEVNITSVPHEAVELEITVPEEIRADKRGYYLFHLASDKTFELVGESTTNTITARIKNFSPFVIAYAENVSSTSTTTKFNYDNVTRIEGSDRYETMSDLIDETYWTEGWAVVASGEKFPDALTASALAGAHECPVILTKAGGLPSQASKQLKNLDVRNVIIVGGESAVSDAVKRSIEDLGCGVDRVAGDNRYATGVEILKAVRAAGSGSDTLFVCAGTSYADALSVGPWAWAKKSPVVLTRADGTLDDDTVAAIKADGRIKRVVIIGGEKAVSEAVKDQLGGGISYSRIGGVNRYDTSVLVANAAAQAVDAGPTIMFATGKNFPDALAAGPVCGAMGASLVLADEPGHATSAVNKIDGIYDAYVLGGKQAIGDNVVQAIGKALS